MSSFGEHLRQQREMRGISLDEIVATTKIGRRLLLALEEEQFDLLPGGIFNKSYVRAYAKCVGINEDEAVAEYLEASKEAPPDTRVIAQQHASIHSDRRPQSSGFPLVPVLILLVVAVGGVSGWKMYQQRLRERAQQRAQTESTQTPTAATPAATPPSSGSTENSQPASQAQVEGQGRTSSAASQTPNASSAPVSKAPPAEASRVAEPATASEAAPGATFEITVRPKDRAWVSIKADGNYVVRGIIKPPEVRTIHANSQVVFFTGNAGAVEVAFDGKNVPLTGGANSEQTLVFDSHGLLPKAPAQ